MSLELRPTGKTISAGNFELRFGQRSGITVLEQVLSLILQVPEVRAFWK